MGIRAGYSYAHCLKSAAGETGTAQAPTSGPPTAPTAIPQLNNCLAQFNETPTGLPVKKNLIGLNRLRQYLQPQKRGSPLDICLL